MSKIAPLATAAVAVAALWFSGQSLNQTKNQYALSEEGQITDRFGKSIEQIGSDKIDVRLGGIYALERLARDSPADHPTVFEVLGAFTRTHAPTTATCSQQPIRIAIDVQAAVTVIGRRNRSHDGPNPIDLSNSCLAGAHLTGTDLTGANLTGANLTAANLTNANLTGAKVIDAILNADLISANLAGADLAGTHMPGANLTAADLTGATLTSTDLTGATLTGANLTRAHLTYTSLFNAHLSGANLTDARLTGSTTLTGADLTGADLAGADLRATLLYNPILKDIHYTDGTKWPQGFTPPPSR